MRNGDLVRTVRIDTQQFYIWGNPPGQRPVGVLKKGEVAVVVSHDPDIGRVQILTKSGAGWISDGLVERVT
jgi:hypothetical protein